MPWFNFKITMYSFFFSNILPDYGIFLFKLGHRLPNFSHLKCAFFALVSISVRVCVHGDYVYVVVNYCLSIIVNIFQSANYPGFGKDIFWSWEVDPLLQSGIPSFLDVLDNCVSHVISIHKT